MAINKVPSAPLCPQLNLLNQEIEKLATRKPYGDIYGVFALAAHLAGEAIAATAALQQDRSSEDFQPTLAFWHRLRDYCGTAALNCGGGNQTLGEALVTYRLLTEAAGDVPNAG